MLSLPSDEEYSIFHLVFTHKLRPLEEDIIMHQGAIALSLNKKSPKNFNYLVSCHKEKLENILSASRSLPHFLEYLQNTEIVEKEFHPEPIPICADLSIIDPSLEPNPGTNIRIEAGRSFGTGHHPSTQLLLKWLHTHSVKDKTVCDLGCGSGILGVYAKMRGAASVVCVDIEKQALLDTLHHAELNAVEVEVADQMPQKTFDIIISNCEQKVLELLKEDIVLALKPSGFWIITGIIRRVWNTLKKEFPQWSVIAEDNQGQWILVGLEKPTSPELI